MSQLADAAAAAAAGAEGDKSATGGDKGAGDPAAGAPYLPDGFDKTFAGTSDRETIDKLWTGLADARKGSQPGKEEDYVLADLPEALKPLFAKADDPLYASARKAAAEAGIPVNAFNSFVTKAFGPLAEAGKLAAPFEPLKEIETFAKAVGLNAADKPGIAKEIGDLDAFATGLAAQLKVPAEVAAEFTSLADTASGLQLLRALKGRLADAGFRLDGGAAAAAAWSKEDLKKLAGDPRIDPSSPKYDREFRQKYDEAYRKAFP